MARKPQPDQDNTLVDALLDESPPEAGAEATAEQAAGASRVRGLGRIFRGNKTLWATTLVAALCLVAGLVLGRFVLSPADAAANSNAPKPGYITVPVEFGELSNDVTLRGQIGYSDATEVKLSQSELVEASVVTGHVPQSGDELEAGDIALEIAGRPVFVLAGELPAYRSLRYGASGPDVSQLKKALNALGLKAGKGSKFDKTLANAIKTLYTDAGYTPAVDKGAADGVRTARDGVRSAEEGVRSAKRDLSNARPSKSAIQALQNQVTAAKNQIRVAKARLKEGKEAGLPQSEIIQLEGAVKDAEGQLRVANAALSEGKKVDTAPLKAAVKSAESQLKDAKKQLATAQNAALPFLPSAEVLFLTQLPRRVNEVNVSRGSSVDGTVMTVSGATIELTGSAADSDAKLLEVGDEAFFDLPDGTPHRAVISKIETATGGGRATISFTPDPLEPEMIQQIQGMNVRVKVPVGATEGEVLSVPFAALTAGPGGESRVEVVEGDPRDPQVKTRLVTVTPGLMAGGYVEVTPTEGSLKAGDLVVVGA